MLQREEVESIGKTNITLHAEDPSLLEEIHARLKVPIPSTPFPLYPNQPVVLKYGQQSALALVSPCGNLFQKIDTSLSFFKIIGENKEQSQLLNIFQNPDIRLIVVTGRAGTGKSVMTGSYALHQVLERKQYSQLILSKPLEIVGESKYWGTVPGAELDKFAPFLKSYQMMFEGIMGGRQNASDYVEVAMQKKQIDFMPLELMRGASLRSCICWMDEAQTLNFHEMNTLGSRIDDIGKSKLILTGDLNQRDRDIERGHTGLHKLVSSEIFLRSPYTAHVELIQNKRGVISSLFHEIFDN